MKIRKMTQLIIEVAKVFLSFLLVEKYTILFVYLMNQGMKNIFLWKWENSSLIYILCFSLKFSLESLVKFLEKNMKKLKEIKSKT